MTNHVRHRAEHAGVGRCAIQVDEPTIPHIYEGDLPRGLAGMAAFIVPDYQTRTYPNPQRSKAYCLIGQQFTLHAGSFVVIEQSTERRSTANPLPPSAHACRHR